jgi:SAM-dependent methyltransferase
VDADYAAQYERLYFEHWWWRARERFLDEELRKRSPAGGFGSILDVGCGNGLAFPFLRRFGEPEGIEPDASLVTQTGEARGRIHRAPFDQTFEPGRRYGLVLFLDVLEHLDRPVEALAHAGALLQPEGGAVAVTVPALPALWTSHDTRNHHRRRYTRSLFEEQARQARLVVVASQYWFGWLAALKLLARAVEAVLGPRRQHAVPPLWFNATLYRLARLERAVWRRSCPVGSSLFFWLEPEAGS